MLFAQCGDTYTGEGTFYGYGGGGNCSFPDPNLPAMTGAMNELQYDTSAICGACVEVTGPKGRLTIRIEDRCPECAFGDIDLAEDAFPYIADYIDGRVPISWKIIPCPVSGALQFYFKEGSSQWWTGVQVRNHKYPIEKFEYKVGTDWVLVDRMMYNYFIAESGMGPGPYDFRITDIFGHIVEENGIVFQETTIINGTQQFADCIENGNSSQVISLKEGWNLITLNVVTEEMNIATLFPNATTVKNQDGFYNSSLTPFLNTYSTILEGAPYLLYNNVDEQLTFRGTSYIPPANTILAQGWNLVAYPYSEVKEISPFMNSIQDSIITIKNNEGFWQPFIFYSSIEYFLPGNAYFIQTNTACSINW